MVGGNPPEDLQEGFGEWAASVDEKPMPVQIMITALTSVSGNLIDPFTYGKMFTEYVIYDLHL